MDPTDLTDSSKPDNPKEQDKTKKSGHAALPPDRAHRSSDPLPDLNPGMPPKPKPIIKRKKSQFGRRRKKRSRTREAWEQHQMEQQQGPDLGSAQEEEDTEPDPGRDEAGELLGPFLRGLPNEGPDGDGLGPDPDLGPDEEDEEGEGTEPDPGRRRDELAGFNVAATATRRTDQSDDTVRRLRAEKKALSLRLRYAERKITPREANQDKKAVISLFYSP